MEEEYLEIESGIREVATYPQPSMWSVDYALKILVKNAIKEFGYAPRDMCRGVFNLGTVRDCHDNALRSALFQDLEKFGREFTDLQFLETDSSQFTLQVYPHLTNVGLYSDEWTVDFKTDHIAKKVSVKMREIDDQRLRVTYRHYRNESIASAFAGSLFKSIIHNMLTLGWRSDGVPPPLPICMSTEAKSNANFPIFTTDPPSTFFSAPVSLSLLFKIFKSRRSTEFDFDRTAGINNHVTLEENVLYLPTSPNNPLFDSFTIDITQNIALISIFKITISEEHGGSADGYRIIRKIMTRVRQLMKTEADVTEVKVAYFGICCSDRPNFQWKMPVGWTECTITNDHRGDVFCVKVHI